MAIAAFLTSMSEATTAFTNTLARKIAGDRGIEWARLCVMTVRSVVQGVIGIALIQATVAYIGFVLFGIPLAVVFAFLILLIAIAQLPALLVLIFPMIYMFSTASTRKAVGFSVFAIILGLSDNVLKPLLGRGVDAPMLVILLGAIGGMLVWGILGLFIGSVLLAVAYKLFLAWFHFEAKSVESVQTKRLQPQHLNVRFRRTFNDWFFFTFSHKAKFAHQSSTFHHPDLPLYPRNGIGICLSCRDNNHAHRLPLRCQKCFGKRTSTYWRNHHRCYCWDGSHLPISSATFVLSHLTLTYCHIFTLFTKCLFGG